MIRNEWKWRNLHCWQKFYTAAGMDKSHIWRGWLGVSLSTDWSPGPRFKLCHQVFVHIDGKKFSTHLLTLLSLHLPCQLSPASWNLTPKRKLRMRMQMQMQVTFSNLGKLLVVGIKLMTKPPECRQAPCYVTCALLFLLEAFWNIVGQGFCVSLVQSLWDNWTEWQR